VTVAAAVTCAAELRLELEAEVVRAREERVVLRSLDGGRIQQRLEERLEFLQRAELLQQRLRVAQAAAANELGLAESTADAIATRSPRGKELAALLSDVRALASTLGELAALNQSLAERALGCTRAYTRAMSPRPAAYGRLGRHAPGAALAAVSSRRA
jgi:FlgN protein